MIIDFHVHVFPDPLESASAGIEKMGQTLQSVGGEKLAPYLGLLSGPGLQMMKRQVRSLANPLAGQLHKAQTMLRWIPPGARKWVDEVTSISPLPRLLIESSPTDLLEAMDFSDVERAVVIAAPPLSSNEFVLETVRKTNEAHGEKLIAAVNIPPSVARPAIRLKSYVKRGARLLKIHAAADGLSPDDPHYQSLLKVADDLGLPVIIHTGCIHSHALYRKPEMGEAKKFSSWFENYPQTRFILAHMNFHEPAIAMDLAENFANIFLDTSWQPAETIAEATRRIGAERILFASDWPLLGDNIQTCISRIKDCVESGMITEEDGRKILGENAQKILSTSASDTLTDDETVKDDSET